MQIQSYVYLDFFSIIPSDCSINSARIYCHVIRDYSDLCWGIENKFLALFSSTQLEEMSGALTSWDLCHTGSSVDISAWSLNRTLFWLWAWINPLCICPVRLPPALHLEDSACGVLGGGAAQHLWNQLCVLVRDVSMCVKGKILSTCRLYRKKLCPSTLWCGRVAIFLFIFV